MDRELTEGDDVFVDIKAIICNKISPLFKTDFDSTEMALDVLAHELDIRASQTTIITLMKEVDVMTRKIRRIVSKNVESKEVVVKDIVVSPGEVRFEFILFAHFYFITKGPIKTNEDTDSGAKDEVADVDPECKAMKLSAKFGALKVFLQYEGKDLLEAGIIDMNALVTQQASGTVAFVTLSTLCVIDHTPAADTYRSIVSSGEENVLKLTYEDFTEV